jgi:hypothetical protein
VYRVVLEAAEGDDAAPPAVRLRHALKRAWRQDRLKCTRAEQLAWDSWGPVDDSPELRDGAGI